MTATSPEEQEYRRRTPASARCFEEARRYLPGGDSRSTLFYQPYPALFTRGEGCRVVDLDGNGLLDFTGNHSSLVHGYCHPAIAAAVRRQLEAGTCFPGPTEPQLRLARLLCERVPSIELVRFTNSGTEASLNAIRAARAFTGRRLIAWAKGAYHGTLAETMSPEHPDAIVLPFGDAEAAVRRIEERAGELAAVLVEPVQGSAGMIPASPEYLRRLREVTSRLGILLVFDEVVSFRIAWGGAQEHFGVTPDLTVLGKLIGGGFPLGAFGGRKDVMELFDPSRGSPVIPHPGSYNANPMSLAAGEAALELLTREAIAGLNRNGESLRTRLRETLDESPATARVTGLGSLFAIHPSPADPALRHRIFLGLYCEGILIDPRGVGTLSTVIGAEHMDRLIEALRVVLSRLPAQRPAEPVAH
ncbi:MAG: aminotransferase class III-fold pyridoxal phosphate-dependent enzyme [Gemmatimonadales bacterium]|nr:aminotransferase class III-fold pyridoxal phosphate-dependent enzyme [Gemmatimonadales bacterium]